MSSHLKGFEIDQNENVELSEAQSISIKQRQQTNKCNKSFRKGFTQIYHEYCANTSIHGVQYLGENRPLKEKFFWLCVFVVSIYCCANLINDIYIKWNETPVIVSFAEKSTPVWSIPFPAVTICSETKRVLKTNSPSYGKLFGHFTKDTKAAQFFKHKNLSADDLVEFRTLLQVCNPRVIDNDFPRIQPEDIDYFAALDRILPPFEHYFYFCRWLSHFNECNKYFTKTYTEEGICFTFNGLKATDLYREDTFQYQHMNATSPQHNSNKSLMWSLQNGYDVKSGVKTYPERVLSAGARAGLFIALQSFKKQVDYACRGPVQGFKVLLHSPDDLPHVSTHFVRIPMGKEVLIAVKPSMITTSVGIAGYLPIRRQCYLHTERSLRFFKIYTQSNCELECLANFTLNKCGCVKFSMPRTMDMPVCGEDKIYCYDHAEDELLVREFKQGLKGTKLNFRGDTECNCMPACTSLVYNTEISQGNFDFKQMLTADGDTSHLSEFPDSQMSRLSIYFKEHQFITSKRSELYGITDFLANCGGIFGLFMGFSILSMVEMIYHFSLRFWSNMKRIVIP